MAWKFRKVDDAIDQPERRKSYKHYFNDAPNAGLHPLTLTGILWSQRNHFQERQCPSCSNAETDSFADNNGYSDSIAETRG